MVETKREYKESVSKRDDPNMLFFGGRVDTPNVNATEDKSKFVKAPATLSSGGNATSTS
jgi:hypothetical protein